MHYLVIVTDEDGDYTLFHTPDIGEASKHLEASSGWNVDLYELEDNYADTGLMAYTAWKDPDTGFITKG